MMLMAMHGQLNNTLLNECNKLTSDARVNFHEFLLQLLSYIVNQLLA